jgi:hypothetical protein
MIIVRHRQPHWLPVQLDFRVRVGYLRGVEIRQKLPSQDPGAVAAGNGTYEISLLSGALCGQAKHLGSHLQIYLVLSADFDRPDLAIQNLFVDLRVGRD